MKWTISGAPILTLLAVVARDSVHANERCGQREGYGPGHLHRDHHHERQGYTDKPNHWFSFGDSYTWTDFNPYGKLPNNANPIGNPAYPNRTTTGGENWVGYVTTRYNNSLLYTYNYARGGAVIDPTLLNNHNPSLIDQVNQFLNTVGNKPASTPWTSADALFSIWMGMKDIRNSYHLGGDRGAFADALLNAEFAQVQKLYKAGARNFLFANVPCIDRSPSMLVKPALSQSLEKTVALFNKKLAAKVNAFNTSNAGVKTWLWDTNAQFTNMLNSPRKYGFKDATSVGAGSDTFWGDAYHPSTYAHKYLGQLIGPLVLSDSVWYRRP